MNLKHFTLLFSSCAVLAACGGGEKEKEKETPAPEQVVDTTKQEVSNEEEALNESTDFKFHVFLANIPSPLEAMVELNRVGLRVDKASLNPIENAEKYNTLTKKALNYGVYGTDLGYLAANDMTQEVSDYFATVKTLAEELGAVEQFNKVLTDKFQANLDNHDSLIILMDNALGATDDYLRNNQRLELATLSMTGSWVESQHLTLTSWINTQIKGDMDKLNQSMIAQKNHIKSLIDLLGEQSSNDCKIYKAELENLKRTYDKINSVDDIGATLKEVAAKVKKLRDKITR